jgi:hypothetical protein
MVNEYIFFGVGSISLVISLILLSRFIAFWWSLLMLLTTPAWFYLGLTLGSELDARVSHKKGSELELKMQKISEEQKLLREQNTQEEKDFDENQRAQTEKWKKELESPGMKSD